MRSKSEDVRDFADGLFVDLLMGVVKLKNPTFQESVEAKVDDLIASKNSGLVADLTAEVNLLRKALREAGNDLQSDKGRPGVARVIHDVRSAAGVL